MPARPARTFSWQVPVLRRYLSVFGPVVGRTFFLMAQTGGNIPGAGINTLPALHVALASARGFNDDFGRGVGVRCDAHQGPLGIALRLFSLVRRHIKWDFKLLGYVGSLDDLDRQPGHSLLLTLVEDRSLIAAVCK